MTADDPKKPIYDSEPWTGHIPEDPSRPGLTRIMHDATYRQEREARRSRDPSFKLSVNLKCFLGGIGCLVAAYTWSIFLDPNDALEKYSAEVLIQFLVVVGVSLFVGPLINGFRYWRKVKGRQPIPYLEMETHIP